MRRSRRTEQRQGCSCNTRSSITNPTHKAVLLHGQAPFEPGLPITMALIGASTLPGAGVSAASCTTSGGTAKARTGAARRLGRAWRRGACRPAGRQQAERAVAKTAAIVVPEVPEEVGDAGSGEAGFGIEVRTAGGIRSGALKKRWLLVASPAGGSALQSRQSERCPDHFFDRNVRTAMEIDSAGMTAPPAEKRRNLAAWWLLGLLNNAGKRGTRHDGGGCNAVRRCSCWLSPNPAAWRRHWPVALHFHSCSIRHHACWGQRSERCSGGSGLPLRRGPLDAVQGQVGAPRLPPSCQPAASALCLLLSVALPGAASSVQARIPQLEAGLAGGKAP